MVIRRAAMLALCLLVTLGPRAHAQSGDLGSSRPALPPEAARTLFLSGVEKARTEQWKAAEDDFRASYALVPRPSTLYNLALVLYRQHRHHESFELCDAILGGPESPTDAPYLRRAELLRARIRQETATVDVVVDPEQSRGTIDGRDMAARGRRRQVMLLAGAHVFEFSADGYQTRRVELAVRQGDRHTLTVELPAVSASGIQPPPASAKPQGTVVMRRSEASTAQPPAPPSSSRLPQWLLMGSGGTLLAAGAVTGIMALNADAEFEGQCPALRDCDQSLSSLQDRMATLSTATDVLLVSGGLAVGGALLWLLLSHDTLRESGPQLELQARF